MPKLPPVSGERLVHLLERLGYRFERQRSSHARYSLVTVIGTHHITVPMHKSIAKGTLNDILNKVSLNTGISKEDLISRL